MTTAFKTLAAFRRLLDACLWGSVSLAMVAGGSGGAVAATTTVGVSGFSFVPNAISIQAGDTVVWNGLGTTHSVASDTPPETMCGVTPVPGGTCTHTFNTPGTYFYHCVNHVAFGMTGVVNVAPVSVPPSVAITNPLAGTVFAAPASVKLFASAASADGSITNVQFFGNGTSLGTVLSPPFNLTTDPLSAGSYELTATATATTGLSATSAPVSISVVTPVAVSNYAPRVTNGQFVFNHTANPGLRYAVEHTGNMTTWSPLVTNTAVSNSVEVGDSFQVGNLRFYRVSRLPNP